MADKKTILTLNLGSQRIGMARFSMGAKGTLLLRDFAFEELPGEISSDMARKSITTTAIKSLVNQLKATGAEVNYAIPSHGTITRFVKVPSLGEDQIGNIVKFEAQQAVPFPLAETVWDYQVVGKAGGEADVAIAAIRADQLEDINQSVTSAGINTKLVEAGPIALYNAFRYSYGEPREATLLIDIGSRMTDAIFMEGNKLFVASFPVGGSNVTAAIAKEMETDFDNAEARKKADGFVHLGGNYADHDDPQVDAMSKIIRNQLTRLHSEINRRIQQYKSQGGTSPASVYLAGAAAAMPYMKEFLEEKLRLPVHWFNALENVSVGPKIDVEAASRQAHCLGELVGLALREMSCPLELDLSPRSVELAQAVARKKPKLFAATAALFAGLAAVFAHFHFSTVATNTKQEGVSKHLAELNRYKQGILAEESRQKLEETRSQYLSDAVSRRQYWLGIVNLINSKLNDEDAWLTQFQPLDSDGMPLTKPLFGEGAPHLGSFPAAVASKVLKPGEVRTVTVDSIELGGLFTKNSVRAIFERLKDAPEGIFEVPADWDQKDIDKWFAIDTGSATSLVASPFNLRLPLKNKFKLSVTEPAR